MAKVFISHSWKDNEISRKIAQYLKQDGAEIWIDYTTIKSGAIPVRISQALEWCDTMVLIWSKSAADSYYVGLEWQSALDLQKQIIPCIIDNTNRPAILRGFLYVDFKDFDKGYEKLLQALEQQQEKPAEQPSKPVENGHDERAQEKQKKLKIKSPEEPVRIEKVREKKKVLKLASLFLAILIIGFIGIYLLKNITTQREQKTEKVTDQKSAQDSIQNDWENWQSKMNANYQNAQQQDSNTNLAANTKAQLWQEFLTKYADDNPYSQQDNDQRAQANQRQNYWLTYQPPPAKPPPEKTVKGMKLVLIPGGTFEMGDTFGDGENEEKPVHTVTVSDFYMSKTEITVGQFRKFVEVTGYRTDAEKEGWAYAWTGSNFDKVTGASWLKPGFSQSNDHPVVDVSWNDAMEFCKWAGCRLPTEAEWEYVARNKGQRIKYSWGNAKPINRNGGNVADESAKRKFSDWTIFERYDDGYIFNAPVASYESNGLGLYDMTGNVWEWCADWYDENFYQNSPENNPKGPSFGNARVVRGGSWRENERGCRLTLRAGNGSSISFSNVGFRVVQ